MYVFSYENMIRRTGGREESLDPDVLTAVRAADGNEVFLDLHRFLMGKGEGFYLTTERGIFPLERSDVIFVDKELNICGSLS